MFNPIVVSGNLGDKRDQGVYDRRIHTDNITEFRPGDETAGCVFSKLSILEAGWVFDGCKIRALHRLP